MRRDKKTAFGLRKRGHSYNSISRKLGVSTSTLSVWFSKLSWSKELKQDLTKKAFEKVYPQLKAMQEAHKKKWQDLRYQARIEAKREFKILRNNPLFISGVMLYWGEGDKKNKNSLRLANTDPALIKIYKNFLRKTCSVAEDKINVWLLLYPDLDEVECKKFWIDKAELRINNFKKSMVIKGRHEHNRLSYGVCNINVHNSYLKEKMSEWINLFSK